MNYKILNFISTALFIASCVGLGWFIAKQEKRNQSLEAQIFELESDKEMLKTQLHFDSVFHRRKVETLEFELQLEKISNR